MRKKNPGRRLCWMIEKAGVVAVVLIVLPLLNVCNMMLTTTQSYMDRGTHTDQQEIERNNGPEIVSWDNATIVASWGQYHNRLHVNSGYEQRT